jgi:hypothetical protein
MQRGPLALFHEHCPWSLIYLQGIKELGSVAYLSRSYSSGVVEEGSIFITY